jgi:hypothetical protein
MGKGVGWVFVFVDQGCILVVWRILDLNSGGFSDYLEEGPAWIVVVCNLDLKVQKKNTIAFSFINNIYGLKLLLPLVLFNVMMVVRSACRTSSDSK